MAGKVEWATGAWGECAPESPAILRQLTAQAHS
jgi:hypothetical protein